MSIDPRTEETENTKFKNLRIRDDTKELDIVLALLPLSPESLLQILGEMVRGGQDSVTFGTWRTFILGCALFLVRDNIKRALTCGVCRGRA